MPGIRVLPGDGIGPEVVADKMLFEWLGRTRSGPKAAAALIDAGVDKVVAEARSLTGDLGGKAGTAGMGDAIVPALCFHSGAIL